MPRLLLTDEHWSKLKPIMLESDIYDTSNLRMTLEAVLYKLRVGCPWRDLSTEFGRWNSVFKRFNEWSQKGKCLAIFKAISEDSDHEWSFIDGTIVKAHQHSAGARKQCETAIGKSLAGNTTKVHMAVDSFGLPIHFEITGGQVHDCKRVRLFSDDDHFTILNLGCSSLSGFA
jgi:transposase